jgi:two-component system phosphate regulon sensor histidine kinase PhoR
MSPLLENTEIRGVVAVFHDISDLKRLEQVRRDFVANVSHELRTPVTVIRGYTEILLSEGGDTDSERARRFLEIINNHSERLATLIGDLLALSELESGDLTLELAPFKIQNAVRRSWKLLEQQAHGKGITVDWQEIEDLPPVMADSGRIEQVLINLLDNAIKYTPEGGAISVSASDSGETLTINVSDTGIGIPPPDQPRIFERFYRVNKSRGGDVPGTGLGLSIVKHIVQLHGGAVSVDSIPGRGSTFAFTLKKA